MGKKKEMAGGGQNEYREYDDDVYRAAVEYSKVGRSSGDVHSIRRYYYYL